MTLDKITEQDLAGKGVLGQPDVPGLPSAEMQAKVEQIVREVAIEKINEVIDYILNNTASTADLEHLVLEAGAVTSVFGRAGDIAARTGDYTYDMVGAAAENHAERHKTGGADPLSYADLGAAAEVHTHGSLTNDGKLGNTNGMVVVTGLDGKLETKAKSALGFEFAPAEMSINGAFTAEDNKIYVGDNITDFVITCDAAKKACCHGFVTFGTKGTISFNGFDFVDDADEMIYAANGSRWEFDLARGYLIIRKRSA